MPKHKKQIGWIITIISLLIFLATPEAPADSGTLSATKAPMGAKKKKTIPVEFDFTLSAGYRADDLDWNIAGGYQWQQSQCFIGANLGRC